MPSAPWASPVFWLYTVLIEGGSRGVMRRLAEEGIQSRPLWQCLHRNAPYRDSERIGGEVGEAIQRDALSLPSSVGLSEQDQDRVISALRSILERPRAERKAGVSA
jgi:perosamine synthetase